MPIILGMAAMSAGIASTAGIGALFVRDVFGIPERVILSVGGVFGCAIWGSGLVIGAMLAIGIARFLGEDILRRSLRNAMPTGDANRRRAGVDSNHSTVRCCRAITTP